MLGKNTDFKENIWTKMISIHLDLVSWVDNFGLFVENKDWTKAKIG